MKRTVFLGLGERRGANSVAASSRMTNLYAQQAPTGSTSEVVLLGAAGTRLFADLGVADGVLGLHLWRDTVYAATENALWAINQNGTVTRVGDMPVSGLASMADNGTHLVIVDGVRGHSYDGTTLSQIVDPAFYPADLVRFMDGYLIFNRKATGQFFISRQDSLIFDPTDITEAESQNDDTLAILNDHRELWIGGETSIEVYYNSGNVDFPFERVQGAVIEHGIASPHVMAKADNAVYTLSNEGIAYEHRGYQPVRISTHEIEDQIADRDLSTAFAFAWYDRGHSFIQWTVGDDLSVVFDAVTREWHTRSHIDHSRHHANCYVKAFGKHLVGDFSTGKIYEQSLETYEDAGRPMVSAVESAPIHANRDRSQHFSFEARMQMGVGLTSGQGFSPQAMLQFSDDGGESWSSERWTTIGARGKRKARALWRRLGQSRERRYRLAISDPVPRAIMATGYVEVGQGR
ncbi:MAG: hypothetical protein AAGI03_00735 [Pseudomonadota bacterium]